MQKTRKNFRNSDLFFAFDVDPDLGGAEWDIVAKWCIEQTTPGDVFIDIGANIGYISALVGKFARPKKIIIVEPDTKLLPYIEENIFSHVDLKECEVVVVNRLVLDVSGSHDFYLNLDNPATNSIYERTEFENRKKIEVIATTVDELVWEHQIRGPVVIKIDAEFAESLIWKGMQRSLDLIKAAIMEFHRPSIDRLAKVDPFAFGEEMMRSFDVRDVNNNNIALYKR